jgi:hypothetical protein
MSKISITVEVSVLNGNLCQMGKNFGSFGVSLKAISTLFVTYFTLREKHAIVII